MAEAREAAEAAAWPGSAAEILQGAAITSETPSVPAEALSAAVAVHEGSSSTAMLQPPSPPHAPASPPPPIGSRPAGVHHSGLTGLDGNYTKHAEHAGPKPRPPSKTAARAAPPPPPPAGAPKASVGVGKFKWKGHANALAKRDMDPAAVPAVVGILGLAAVVGLTLLCRRASHRHERLPGLDPESTRGIETVSTYANTYEDDAAVAGAPAKPCYDSELGWNPGGSDRIPRYR